MKTTLEVLEELRQRCAEKIPVLEKLRDNESGVGDSSLYSKARLQGKMEGVDLAISYIDEAIKDANELQSGN